jgi:hypothetical protein
VGALLDPPVVAADETPDVAALAADGAVTVMSTDLVDVWPAESVTVTFTV